MLTAINLIRTETAGRTIADYQANAFLRAGVERCFDVIGEAARRIERHDPTTAELIPDYRTIIDFRNRLAHGYDRVDHRLVWQYVESELPALRECVADLLRRADMPSEAE